MKKIKIKRERIGIFLIVAVVIVFIVLLAAFKDSGDTEALYGNRLDDVKEYPVKTSTLKKIESEIKKTDKVETVTSRVQGRIVVVDIIIKKETSRDDAKLLADIVANDLSEKQKELYDVQIFIDKDDDATFPIIGYRHKKKDAFSWTVDR